MGLIWVNKYHNFFLYLFKNQIIMKKILIILLFIPLISFGQETEPTYKITTKSGDIYQSKKYKVNEKKKVTYIETLEGKIVQVKSNKITSIRKLIEGWNYFDFNANGFTDFSVVQIDTLKKEEIYKLVIEWIKVTYNTPDKVIKAQIENKNVRIEGFADGLASHFVMFPTYYGTTYSIVISVRDGKYKFDPKWSKYTIPPSQYSSGSEGTAFSDSNEDNAKFMFNKKGKVKGMYRKMPNAYEVYFNDLNMSLYEYIKNHNTKQQKESSDDDW
jgi:hypothetical protein